MTLHSVMKILADGRHALCSREFIRGAERVSARRNPAFGYMRSAVTVALLLVGASLFGASPTKPKATPTQRDQLQHTLETTILTKVEFHEATLQEAVAFLSQEANRLAPKQRIRLILPADLAELKSHPAPDPVILSRPPESYVPGLDSPPSPFPYIAPLPTLPLVGFQMTPNPADARITFSLSGVPLLDAVRYVSNLAWCKFRIDEDGVRFVALDAGSPMHTRDFRMPAGFFVREKEARANFRQYLEMQGVNFSGGGEVILNDEGTRLTVHHTEDQLELIHTILYPPPPPKPGTPKQIETKLRKIAP